MKPIALAALVTSLGLSAQAADFQRIASEAAFRTVVADRTLVDKFGDTLLFATNGGIAGNRDAFSLTGGWVWNDGALCHRTRLNGLVIEVDCKHVYYRADMVLLLEARGRSTQEAWRFR
ncbi:MAG: hypothetical protein AAFY65_11900 [Pseudomonadota bacterium]